MLNLDNLRTNYSADAHTAFEDMCTMLFCTVLNLSRGVNRRKNQKGIESDPVKVNGKVYAYQAKFYDNATRLRDKKQDFIEAIEAARQEGVTDLMIFVNKIVEDKKHPSDGSVSEEPAWLKAVYVEASGKDGKMEVRLDWWWSSVIENTLEIDKYHSIRDTYLARDKQRALGSFYDWTYKKFYGDTGNELYGKIPLSEAYIEPTIKLNNGNLESVREYIEQLVDRRGGGGSITILCGEPGHGKTSLCRKAVCDFYKTGWLSGKVSHVFHFSLKPVWNDANMHSPSESASLVNSLFGSLLSWGEEYERTTPDHMIETENCRNALVFLDGFDELLESYPIKLQDLIRKPIVEFSRNNNAHVIITTRSTVIESDRTEYNLGKRNRVPIVRLQPLTKEKQHRWIEQYIDWLRRSIEEDDEHVSKKHVEEVQEELEKVRIFFDSYKQLDEDTSTRYLLGIPIIFRMVVALHYLPKGGESVSRLYDELFDAIWKRYELLDLDVCSMEQESMDAAKQQLSLHALRVFADDTYTAVVSEELKSRWRIAFYTRQIIDVDDKSKRRVGFLHRSIYQHFLAKEIVSWFKRYVDNEDEEYNDNALYNNLSYLARRRLDKTTLDYIQNMHSDACAGSNLDNAFARICQMLKETDGILPLPIDSHDSSRITVVPPLTRANNVFWNMVSICGVCKHEIMIDSINMHALRTFDLNDCCLSKKEPQKPDTDEASSSHTLLEDAFEEDLALTEAVRQRIELQRANLEGAILEGADLRGVDLTEAHLENARLKGANLQGATLNGASLRGAELVGAHLEKAEFLGADLQGAVLLDAHLQEADFRGAKLRKADLRGRDLRGARFVKMEDLENARIDKESIKTVIFEERSQRAPRTRRHRKR